jgi:hypothetical protein
MLPPPLRRTMPPTAPITDANPTVEDIERRVARFHRLNRTDDYVDAAIRAASAPTGACARPSARRPAGDRGLPLEAPLPLRVASTDESGVDGDQLC